MSKQNLTLRELTEETEKTLKELDYQKQTIYQYRSIWKQFLKHSGESEIFTEALGMKFLKENYGELSNQKDSKYRQQKCAYRSIRLLADYQTHGVILRSKSPSRKKWVEKYEKILFEFKEYATAKELAESSIHRIEQVLEKLFEYLHCRKITDLSELKIEDIDGFTKTLSGYAVKTLSVSMYSLKVFLKYLYEQKLTHEELYKYVPKVRFVKRRNIPSTWTEAETTKILESIDRGNPCGKRDYAILLLISRLGLRKSDVTNLKFNNICWEKNVIELTQKKTGQLLTLPLMEDVGNAIIDYLKNSRPVSDLPYVFLKQAYPFNQMTDVYLILEKYLWFSGVGKKADRQNGPHSLRHSLAGRLLEKDTSVEVISSILGHSNTNVTNEYLKIDLKSLAECALDPEEVLHSVFE